MKYIMIILGLVIAGCVQSSIPVIGGSLNDPALEIESDTGDVHVLLRLHEVKSQDPVMLGACTGSRDPCSLIVAMEVRVANAPLHVPGSVFRDLSDLRSGEIKRRGNDFLLTLRGGDASESYVAVVEFDEERIKRRSLASSLAPDQLLEETIYNEVSLGD